MAIVEYERPRTAKIIPEFAELSIRSEGSGILLFGLESLLALRADIKTWNPGTQPETKERIEPLLNESDALRIFLTDRLQTALGFSLTSNEIVEAFAGFCLNRGRKFLVLSTDSSTIPNLDAGS